jgi:phosphate-selective porin OprO/OprP
MITTAQNNRRTALASASTILTVWLLASPGGALAQTAVPAVAAPPAEPAPAPGAAAQPAVDASAVPSSATTEGAPAAVPPPPVLDVAARLDELDQIARIAARKHELLEEEAAKRAKEAPVFSVDDKGIALKSADAAYTLKIRALLQTDGRFFANDDIAQDKDTFLIRRFRPWIEGTLFGLVDYRLVPDFAGSTTQVMDAYIDVHPQEWLRLRVGKFKAPIGLERLQSDADLSFIERALDQNLSSTRDVGVQLWGDVGGGIVNYSVGVYNGGADGTNADVDSNHAKDFIGRLFFQPFKAEGLAGFGNLGVGVAASTGNRKGLPVIGTAAAVPGLPSFRTSGQNTFFAYLAPGTDPSGTGTVFAHLRASRLNPQLYYFVGPFGILGEYTWSKQSVQKGNDQATLTHQAAHGTVNFVFNGKAGYDGATPLLPFDFSKGALGAVELAARWSWLKIDADTFSTTGVAGNVSYADPLKNASEAQSFGGAINYIPRRSFRLALDFEQTRFKGGAAAADKKTVADRKSENVIIGRAQVNF